MAITRKRAKKITNSKPSISRISFIDRRPIENETAKGNAFKNTFIIKKGKLFKWAMDRKEIAENVKVFFKLYKENKLVTSHNLGWGLSHGNPKEISLNVGEVQRIDVLMKTVEGWCITLGRETLEGPVVLSHPYENQKYNVEIIISGKNFPPISTLYEINFPEDLVKFAKNNTLFIQK